MKLREEITIREYVAKDFRTAAVFSNYGIDFYCKGNRTIQEACDKKGHDPATTLNEINAVLNSKNDNSIDFKSRPLDLLADYIERTHQRYVEEKTQILLPFLDRLCSVHGVSHPELFAINELFAGCEGELAQLIKKEEQILFPFITKVQTNLC
ncbi:DUF542 domain-containing protein [Flavobacterium piscis]|uniref:Iron-sulfur cluster repair di-iron protein n=1 Tax=Flavobacterium piscis TaxID=1114874 RepID=A0ABU1YDK3_9FLAO|nr:DUF542 domain-containing protein [Flavobacterium piscis]MDR7212312.1 iron-sulfur cluster repair di-iron protein [Flavobacterium piscis]